MEELQAKVEKLEKENAALRETISELKGRIVSIEQEKEASLLKVEMEKDQKLKQLTSLISGSQKKGWLWKEKHGLKNKAMPWHKRFFILKDNILAWYRDESASSKPSGHIYVEHYRVYKLEGDKKPFCFELIDERDNHIKLAAENDEEYKGWMEALKNAKNRKMTQKQIVPSEEDDFTFSDAPSSGKEGVQNYHPDDAKPVIKEGVLDKKGVTRRNWNTRWFVLRGTTLSYYTAQDQKVLKGRVPLAGARILTHAVKNGEEKPLIFAIRNPDRDFIMRADSIDEKEAWIKAFKDTMTAAQ